MEKEKSQYVLHPETCVRGGFYCCVGCTVESSHPGTEATGKDVVLVGEKALTKNIRFYSALALRSASLGVLQLRAEGG